jgi:hypothetical protein
MDLALLAQPLAAAEGVSWRSLGLTACIVGCFLLANSVLLRDPGALVAQRFGRPQSALRSAREIVFQRVQTGLGFLFLVAGFALQLAGGAADAEPVPGSLALWVGGLAVLAIVLEGLGWIGSLFVLRRQVRAFLREGAPDLAGDVQFARELGDLFGVRAHADDTVQSYLERLSAHLGLARPARAHERASGDDSAFEEVPIEPQPPPPQGPARAPGVPRLR